MKKIGKTRRMTTYGGYVSIVLIANDATTGAFVSKLEMPPIHEAYANSKKVTDVLGEIESVVWRGCGYNLVHPTKNMRNIIGESKWSVPMYYDVVVSHVCLPFNIHEPYQHL